MFDLDFFLTSLFLLRFKSLLLLLLPAGPQRAKKRERLFPTSEIPTGVGKKEEGEGKELKGRGKKPLKSRRLSSNLWPIAETFYIKTNNDPCYEQTDVN